MDFAPLAAGGLVLDAVGAFLLASAFAFKRPRDIRAETAGQWGYNATLNVSLAKQTADAWVAGTLLVVGFAGQFASSVGAEGLSLRLTLGLALVISGVALALLRLVLRPWNVRRMIAFQLAGQRPEEWRGMILNFGRAAIGERRYGETPAEYGERMLGEQRWRQITVGIELPPPMHHV